MAIQTAATSRAINVQGMGIASQEYARRVKLLINLITDLRAMGAQADIDLPRIAVIGNQSAGKSSLVEAITGITVPRASGTCTRCPMECRLTFSTQPWKAQVLLRFERDSSGNRLPEVKEQKFGPVLSDKSVLEEMLRRAQLSILNPTIPFTHFVNKEPSKNDFSYDSPQLQFSANVVCLDISGPELTDLSFIDLPGIISNVAEGEDRNNIDLVKNLVKHHIAGNALILLTITMRDDIENQSAAFLAKEADPKGLRTIGVLTKPDTLQAGEEQPWLDVLEGRRHPLHHGYYVTKQPATAELTEAIDHSVARERETNFFRDEVPWSGASPAVRNRMGVPNLTKELSRLLSQLIEQMLPKLRSDSKASMAATIAAINTLPPPLSENPTAQLLQLVTSFSNDLNNYIKGAETCEALIRKCRPAYVTFKQDILRTQPDFRPCESPNVYQDETTSNASSGPVYLDEGENTSNFSQGPMYLDEVRTYLESSLTRQLPFNVPFSAKVGLIERCFEEWAIHSRKCFDLVYDASERLVHDLFSQTFERFAKGGLMDLVSTIVEKQLESAQSATLKRIDWLLELDTPPFTLNDHYFSSYREKYLANYKEQRQGRTTPDLNNDATDALVELARLGFRGLKVEDLQRLHGTDPFEQELICMAEVRAYFQVAYKRIIDNLPRVIDHDFLRTLGRDMQQALFLGLGLGDENAMQRAIGYLSEEPGVVAHREELMQKRERLQDILDKLFRFSS